MKGRPPRLIESVYLQWPIEALPDLDDGLKGLYVLYDPDGQPVRVGISGKSKQDVKSRLRLDYYRSKRWRHVHKFSVFTFKVGSLFNQVETLVLKAVGTGLAGNIAKGRFLKTTKVRKAPRRKYPASFFVRRIGDDGRIKVPDKFIGRRVRVDIGPRSP